MPSQDDILTAIRVGMARSMPEPEQISAAFHDGVLEAINGEPSDWGLYDDVVGQAVERAVREAFSGRPIVINQP